MISRTLCSLAAVPLLAASALAVNGANITIAAQDGQAVGMPSFGNLTAIDNLAVNDLGDCTLEVDTDQLDTNTDGALLRNGMVFLREGDLLPLPSGSMVDSFDSVTLNANGNGGFNFFLDGTTGTTDDSGVYFDNVLVIQESDVSTAAAFTPGTPYIGFFEATLNDANQILIVASIDDAAIASTVDRALVIAQVDGTGALMSETVLWKEADVLPGQTEMVTDFGTGPHASAFNNNGDVIFVADLTGSTATDGVVYLNGTLLAQEGSPSSVPGRTWLSLSSAEVDLGDGGDWVVSGQLAGDTATDLLIEVNGSKLVQEGDTLPDIAPFTLTSFGTGPVKIDDEGNVLWTGVWNDASNNVGLFYNKTLIVQEGVTQVSGMTVTDVRTIQDAFDLSPNGEWAVLEVSLNATDAVLLIDLADAPVVYCTGKTNSLGCVPMVCAAGTPSASSTQPFSLRATDLVPDEFGLFLYGVSGRANLSFHNGTLCVKAPLVRWLPPKSAGSSGNAPCTGMITRNFNARIQSGADPSLTTGQQVNVQLLQRDPGLMDGFDDTLTNGVQFTICP